MSIATLDLWEEAFKKIPRDTKRWRRFDKIVQDEKIPGFKALTTASTTSSSMTTAVSNLQPMTAADLQIILRNLESDVKAKDEQPIRKFCNDATCLLSNVKSVIDPVVSLNPYAAAGWGVVAFLIISAAKHSKTKDFCWQTIPVLADVVHRYQTYQHIYLDDRALPASNDELRQGIVELFTQILNFQIASVIAFESRAERFRTVFRSNDTEQLKDDINQQEQKLKDLQAVISRQTDKMQFQDILKVTQSLESSVNAQRSLMDDKLSLMDDKIDRIKAEIDSNKRRAVLEWISPTRYNRPFTKEAKKPLPKTSDWLLTHRDFTNWIKSDAHAVFWLYGKMGSGKSCMTNAVIKDLKKRIEGGHDACLAFFGCDSTDAEGQEDMSVVEKILRTLLGQVAKPYGQKFLDERLLKLYEQAEESDEPPSFSEAVNCVGWICDLVSTSELFIVIDESLESVQKGILEHLDKIIAGAHGVVKVYIASRNTTVIWRGVESLKATTIIKVDMVDHNAAPIEAMVDAKVAAAASGQEKYSYINDETGEDQTEEVKKLLKTKAGGMFQWVSHLWLHCAPSGFVPRIFFIEVLDKLTSRVTTAINFLHKSKGYLDMRHRLHQISHLE